MENIKILYNMTNYHSSFFLFFLIFLIMIYAKRKKEGKAIQKYFFYSLGGLLICFNPFIGFFASEFMTEGRLVRVYWLLPVTIIISYGCVKSIDMLKAESDRKLLAAFLLFICMISGTYMFREKNYVNSNNLYKLPNEAIQICDAIEEDGNRGLLLSSKDLSGILRQYDADICLVGGKYDVKDYWDACKNEEQIVTARNISVELESVSYVLLDKGSKIAGDLQDFNFEILLDTEQHLLYRKKLENQGEVLVTRYKSAAVDSVPFYTVENFRGELMVVNGSWERDRDILTEIVDKQSGIIDAWIVTNPNVEYLRALEEMFLIDGVDIKAVLLPFVDAKGEVQKEKDWDKSLEDFVGVAEKEETRVLYYHEGTYFSILGTIVNIFHGYDKTHTIEGLEEGELVFKINSENQAMLFFSNVEEECIVYMLDRYGEDLQADYLQMRRSVSEDLNKKICETIMPQRILFDYPDSKYDEKVNQYLKEKEIDGIYCDSVDNQIVLQ